MSEFFKSNLVYLREKKEENQQESAAALGLTRSTYANYETGANLPKADVMAKILGHFGVTFEEVMFSDIPTVHLNRKHIIKNEGQNVHLNVHPSVHLTAKTGGKIPDDQTGEIPFFREQCQKLLQLI
jgi:transcriptional regulator with XRE-family HTH domain